MEYDCEVCLDRGWVWEREFTEFGWDITPEPCNECYGFEDSNVDSE